MLQVYLRIAYVFQVSNSNWVTKIVHITIIHVRCLQLAHGPFGMLEVFVLSENFRFVDTCFC